MSPIITTTPSIMLGIGVSVTILFFLKPSFYFTIEME